MNNNDEFYHLRNVIYTLGDTGPKDIHVCVCGLDLIEKKLSYGDNFYAERYFTDAANEEWNAAFQDIGGYERITDPAAIAALPKTYDFVQGPK